jgi:hypothetical protein
MITHLISTTEFVKRITTGLLPKNEYTTEELFNIFKKETDVK